jgi:hypothetical protein
MGLTRALVGLAACCALVAHAGPPVPLGTGTAPPAASAGAPPSAITRSADARCEVVGGTVRVMLQDLEVTPAFASTKASLGQIVAAEAARVPGYNVISAQEVRSALDQEANKALAGCSGESCLAEIAQALDAALVVSGRVEETLDGASIVSLTMLNVHAMVVMNRVTMPWRGARDLVPEVMHAAAQTLFLEPKDRPPGSLEVLGLPGDARIFVDDEDWSDRYGAQGLAGLAVGPHEVKVEAPGKVPAVTYVCIKSGKNAAITLELEEDGSWIPWILAGTAGALVLGGVGTLVAVYAAGQSDVVVTGTVPAVGVNDVESTK